MVLSLANPRRPAVTGVTTVSMTTNHHGRRSHLGLGPWDVTRSATARWGTIGGATTAPVAISQCSSTWPLLDGTTFPSAEVIIPLGAGGPACPGRPPGAFGWLDTGLSGPCSITTMLNSSGQLVAHGNTGNGNVNPWDCITQVGVNGTSCSRSTAPRATARHPAFRARTTETAATTTTCSSAYAELQITGWNLQHGNPRTPVASVPQRAPSTGSASCIQGRFIQFSTAGGFGRVRARDFGVTGRLSPLS